ncbi:hypothetical protein AFL01nite_04960 [Aeromicrobium flavum]|uniref:Uncharacterized protein n=1 Tax=Aeromicrobium flavum TaxID=416568 RepID=A0A512HRT6_9ACTN|nr:hypothetical protein [Aeromicrobium flavum]GEO88169.1 hypothetical protein AFL01nite_04960 [Aeromicrobium flavum]
MTEALQGLTELARLETERDGLQLQLAAANDQLADAERRHQDAVAKLETETADVEKLESYSMTRILAGLRGTRDVDLSRERAEQLAAQYAVAEADGRRQAAQREVDNRTERLAAIGDLEDRRTRLLAQREREIAADPASATTHARLTEIASRQGALAAETVQLQEAVEAAAHARVALAEASAHLSSAGTWATYDTFFGGGLVGDLVKHNKLDKAGELMRRADAALAHLGAELADVNVDAVGEVGITELARVFDIWFDNIFSDYQVRQRIREAATRIDGLLRDVDTVAGELATRAAGVTATLGGLEASRRELLLA